MNWPSIILKLVLLIVFTGAYVHLHEVAHERICQYAGGHASRYNFTTTLCSMEADNPLVREVYILDCINELIASLFFPIFMFSFVVWIMKTE